MSAHLEMIRELERIADLAYPPERTTVAEGWRYRMSGDLGRRVNSVAALLEGDAPLDEQIDHAEAWYRDRGRRAIFKLTEASRPPQLDAALAARGYVEEAAVRVMTRALSWCEAPGDVDLAALPQPGWSTALQRLSGKSPQRAALLPGLVARAEGPARYAAVRAADEIVGVALGVIAEDHLGLFEVFVDLDRRRRGVGGRMMEALAAWASGRGASSAFLQVEEANTTGRAFYRALGFTEAYRYWYRVAPDRR